METVVTPTQLSWHVAPEDSERFDRWQKCQFDWLNALERRSGGRNTRRAYERDLVDFFAYHSAARVMPWDVTPAHAEAFAQHLRARGLAPATINRRIAALSSLYRYAATEAINQTAGGERTPLWPHPNPFGSRTLRTRTAGRSRAAYPSAAQVTALLSQIDPAKVTGLRNLALLAGMFATTRRVSEWINLNSDDLHDEGKGVWFEYRYKGGVTKTQLIPQDIWRIIRAYLQAAGRWPLAPGQFVFTATVDVAKRLRANPDAGEGNQPISASYVTQLIRRYGKAAGVPVQKLHAHALRHAGARWRREKGADVWQLKDTLGHASLTTTQLYTDTVLSQPEDPFANTIGEILPMQLRFLLR